MTDIYPTPTWWVEEGDSALLLPFLASGLADAIVTDPPAGIDFMKQEWDESRGGKAAWIAWLTHILMEARRILKPGHHGWVWALPRTSHWTATACEEAGFEIRDILTHVQAQGFPKSRSLLKPAAEHWILVRSPGPRQELQIEAARLEPGEGKSRVGEKSCRTTYTSAAGFFAQPGVRGGGLKLAGGRPISHSPTMRVAIQSARRAVLSGCWTNRVEFVSRGI